MKVHVAATSRNTIVEVSVLHLERACLMINGTLHSYRRFANLRELLIGTICLIQSLAAGTLYAEQPVLQMAERPASCGAISSVNAAFADLQFLFELVSSSKDYLTLKETLDLLVTGLDPTRPCLIQHFVRSTDVQTLNLFPVATDEDFRRFLRNIWDTGMCSAPAPEASLTSRIPSAIRAKLKSLNLDRNERLMFDLWDGFARLEGGYARFSQELATVRWPINLEPEGMQSTISFRIDGGAASIDQRHQACSHSNFEQVEKLTRRNVESETAFAVRKSLMNFRLAWQELVFAESSQASFFLNLSHPEKRANLQGSISPVPGSTLAAGIARHEMSVDRFSRISGIQAAVSGTIHFAVPPIIGEAWKALLQSAKADSLHRINFAAGLAETEKSEDREFAELIFDITTKAAAEPISNAFIRIWHGDADSFVSVGGVQLSAAKEYQDRLGKLQSQKQITLPNIPEGIVVYQVVLHCWPREYREFFDRNGTVLVAVGSDTLWFASGEHADDRLAAALREGHGTPDVVSNVAIDLIVNMRPLSILWKNIHDRRSSGVGADKKKASNDEMRSSVLLGGIDSFLSGLDLPSIAVAAYQGEKSMVTASARYLGENYVITANAEEGTLRFAGFALTQFVRENIGE